MKVIVENLRRVAALHGYNFFTSMDVYEMAKANRLLVITFTVSDNMTQIPNTCSYFSQLLKKPDATTSHSLQLLYDAGAVCLGSNATSRMDFKQSNPKDGWKVLNPHDSTRTAGGSSGVAAGTKKEQPQSIVPQPRMAAVFKTAALLVFVCVSFLVISTKGMYADQAGSIDWNRQNLGAVKIAYQPPAPKRSAYVATEAGAIAAVNSNKGNIEWRRILPNDEAIELFLHEDEVLITLSGLGKTLSAWSTKDGAKIWNSNVYSYEDIQEDQINEHFDGVIVDDINGDQVPEVVILAQGRVQAHSGKDGKILWTWAPQGSGSTIYRLHVATDAKYVYTIAAGAESEVVVNVLGVSKGSAVKTQILPASGLAKDSCITVQPSSQLVCLDVEGQNLFLAELRASTEFTKVNLQTLLPGTTVQGASLDSAALKNGFVLKVSQSQSVVVSLSQKLQLSVVYSFTDGNRVFFSADEVDGRSLLASTSVVNDRVQLEILDIKEKKLIQIAFLSNYTTTEHGSPLRIFLNAFTKKDSIEYGTKVMVVGEDHSLSLFSGSRLLWCREEALASVTHDQIIDFPAELAVRDTLQKEFASDPSDNLLSHFVKRVKSEFSQLVHFASSFSSFDPHAIVDYLTAKTQTDNSLVKDKFGLKKLVVVATAPGKLFGLHSVDGSIVWSKYLPHITPLGLFVARGGAHPPPHGILVGSKQGVTVVRSFNMMTGDLEGEPIAINAAIKQSFLLPFVDASFSHPLILLDSSLNIHVYPATPENIAAVNKNHKKIFFYIVDKNENTIEGYGIDSLDRPALPLWNINFHSQNEKIEAVAPRQPNEAIGSPTLSNADLTIRPKYINKNALAVATVASVSYVSATTKKKAYESFVNVYLIDTVTGSIIHRSFFRNAQAPVTLIQSENWLVCHHWNWKLHRYEVSVLEFYETEMKWDATTFSSRDFPEVQVLSQTYVFPSGLTTMGVTETAHGITTKQVLFGLSSERIFVLDRRWLSARRLPKEMLTDQDKAAGIIPYMLRLPTPATNIINYNISLPDLRSIHTAPASLESTSLVFAFGTDLFFTRVTPSQTFDLLSDDFQYLPLVGTISVLVILTFVTSWLVSRKNLAKRWR